MKIGIIGAGAAGLAAAFDLTKKGHDVTVYESAPVSYTHLTLPTNREV